VLQGLNTNYEIPGIACDNPDAFRLFTARIEVVSMPPGRAKIRQERRRKASPKAVMRP
jgi:hypothetical protein